VDFDADLSDDDAGDQGPDDVTEGERTDLQPTDQESDRERQEDGELWVSGGGP